MSPAAPGAARARAQGGIGVAASLALACLCAPADAGDGGAIAARRGESRACMRLLRPVLRGQAIAIADVGRVRCAPQEPLAALHYDRAAGLARAGEDLRPGQAVATIAGSALAWLRRGERVVATTQDGAIRIDRLGRVAVDSHAGATVRVRLDDGRTLAVPASALTAIADAPQEAR